MAASHPTPPTDRLADWQAVDTAEPRHLRESTGIVAAYTQWHLERGLRSLRLVERS